MRAWAFLALFLMVATPAAAQTRSLGVFGLWGSFEKESSRSCYAISEPYRGTKPQGWRAFASVSYWPARGIRSQVHFRLSREKRKGSAVLLRVGDRTFQLLAGARDAWAPDQQADALIVSALRSGVDMTIETRATNGALVRDQYRLNGAATAIDAAAIACAR